jgi:O-antigen/teichoic acid export membrane protein
LQPSYPNFESKMSQGNSLQLKGNLRKHQRRSSLQSIHLEPLSEEQISHLQTRLTFAVRPGDKLYQQQDMLLNTLIEEIAQQETLRLKVVESTSKIQNQAEHRQVITSTAGNAAIAGFGDIISAGLKFVTNIFMTNIVSSSIYGIYITVYTAASIIGMITILGMDSTMTRFLSTYRVKNERSLAYGLLRFGICMTLISSLFCGTLFYLFSMIVAHLVYHQDTYALPLKEVALLIPLIALQPVLANGLMALKAIKWKVYTDRLIQPGVSLLLMGVFYLFGLRLEALVFATICGFLASIITGWLLLGKASKPLIDSAIPKFELRLWMRFALPLSFSSFIYSILNSTDVLFLAAFSTSVQVGIYAAADRVSFLVLMPLIALNTIFSPLIAEYYAHGENKQLASLAKVVTKWAFSLSLPIFLCFCVFHEAILNIFSKGYAAAGIVLMILSLANFIDAGVGSTGDLLVMTGHTRMILANTVAAIIVNIGLSFLLVPRFNIIGAAIASGLALVIPNIAGFVEVYWILKILTLRWDMLKPVVAGVVASAVGLFLLRIIHVGYGYVAIFGVLGLIIPFMLVYVLVLICLRFSKEDMMVIDAIVSKFGKKIST